MQTLSTCSYVSPFMLRTVACYYFMQSAHGCHEPILTSIVRFSFLCFACETYDAYWNCALRFLIGQHNLARELFHKRPSESAWLAGEVHARICTTLLCNDMRACPRSPHSRPHHTPRCTYKHCHRPLTVGRTGRTFPLQGHFIFAAHEATCRACGNCWRLYW